MAISSSAYRHGDALISNVLFESWLQGHWVIHGCVLISHVTPVVRVVIQALTDAISSGHLARQRGKIHVLFAISKE
ncbi:hypothetical protein [Desulfosporosinus sp. OT]|uniref:hypothetical protein n=1 Tax=Desulfosporosinus sp. OT TaxID=913865 RepID=UPI001300C1E3|nr:hypothetical protein [Desulfosporosinus sp. OT]